MVERNIREELNHRGPKELWLMFKKTFKYTYSLNKKDRSYLILLRIMLTTLPIAILYVTQRLINSAIKGDFIITYFIVFAVLTISMEFINYYYSKTRFKNAFKVEYESYKTLFEKISKLDIKDFEDKELHNNLERAKNAITKISNYSERIIAIIFNLIELVLYSIIILTFNWRLIFIIIFPLIMFLKKLKVLKNSYIKRWEISKTVRKKNYYAHVLTSDALINELKTLNADKKYFGKYKKAYDEFYDAFYEIGTSEIKMDKDIAVANSISNVAFHGYLIYNLVLTKIQFGHFNTYLRSFSKFYSSLSYALERLVIFEVDAIEIKEFFLFLEYESGVVDGKKILDKIESVEFKNVFFKYASSNDFVLKNVSFKIDKGEKIAFIGPNGSGKTTIMKLLTKVYSPTKGKILINGISISKYNTRSIRDAIATLNQDYNLYQETVRENISLDDNDYDKETLDKNIAYKDLKERIEELDEKYETILGNYFGKGINFSKGQLQKLALSRVFFRNSSLLLLDEPNSALDPRSEREMFDFIKNIKTTCVITLHVFTNIDLMDKILMFEKGEIVANGNHHDLYKNNEVYKEFYNLQERDDI